MLLPFSDQIKHAVLHRIEVFIYITNSKTNNNKKWINGETVVLGCWVSIRGLRWYNRCISLDHDQLTVSYFIQKSKLFYFQKLFFFACWFSNEMKWKRNNWKMRRVFLDTIYAIGKFYYVERRRKKNGLCLCGVPSADSQSTICSAM